MPLDGSTYGVREGLLRVRELLEREGWCQGRWRGLAGEHCPVNAITSSAATVDQMLAMRQLLDAQVPGGSGIVRWNDAPGRTKEEVLALIDAAIADGEET